MPTIIIRADETAEIDLGNSQGMLISTAQNVAEVYVDYQRPPGSGNYTSAIKASAGYGNPFYVQAGNPKAVLKSDLESEHVRVGAQREDISVTY